MLAFVAVDRRSPVLAGIALGAGTLVKYFPVVAGPSLYRRWDWRLPVAFVATVAVLYLPYLGAGTKVFGFLGEYIYEERIEQGSGIFLWLLLGSVLPLPGNAFSYYFPAAALIMIALALALVLRERKSDAGADLWGAMVLAVTFLVLFSPHYAWYFAWLVPFLCSSERRRPLSDLRGQLALHRALAAAPLRRAHSLWRVLRDPAGRALLPSLSEKGGAPWRRCPRRRSAPLLRERRQAARRSRGTASGLPLSGDDQPLQPAVHHLPAHLRRARAAGRHELGAVHLASSTRCPISRASCCTASASRCW